MSDLTVVECWTIRSGYTPEPVPGDCGERYRLRPSVRGPEQREPIEVVRASVYEGAVFRLEALKARLRQEVDAHRMTLHDRALPMSDEEFDELLGTIPGLEEGR